MEKLIYVLWRDKHRPRDTFNETVRSIVVDALRREGVERLQINIPDAAVDGETHINVSGDLPDATISFWLSSAHIVEKTENVLRAAADRVAGYSVVESTVLPYRERPAADGRVSGFSQLAFFSHRPDLSPSQFRDIWMNYHTANALATQETFYYAQNIINRAITSDAPRWHGIVDEWYPIEALADPLVYWKAVGSEEQRKRNYDRETASILKFVDMASLALTVTSAHRVGGWCD
jgi:hypothetical protein